jgi:SAM-dependent methyltransferase
MLKELEKKAKASKLNCYCIVCDVENPPFKDKTFEVLVCKGVLHHLPDISKAIKEQLRVMDANALLFISEPFKKHAWFSYPYYLTVNVIKAIFKLLRGTRVETLERPLDKSHLDVISGILDRTSHEHNIDYLVYWPIVCRYLPEFICYPFMLFLNRINKENDVGDSVIITARK